MVKFNHKSSRLLHSDQLFVLFDVHTKRLSLVDPSKFFIKAYFVSCLTFCKINLSRFCEATESLSFCFFFLWLINVLSIDFSFFTYCLLVISRRFRSCHDDMSNWLLAIGVVSRSSVELVLIQSNRWNHELLITVNFTSTRLTLENSLTVSYIVVFLHKLRENVFFLLIIQS